MEDGKLMIGSEGKRRQVVKNEKAKNIPTDIVMGDGVVITQKNYALGSLGSGHWFQLREKYCHNGKVRQMIFCADCDQVKQKLATFYKILVNGEEFLVDSDYVVEYNQPIDNNVANKIIYENILAPDIFYPEGNDYTRQTDRITGSKHTIGANYENEQTEDKTHKTIKKDAGITTQDEGI